MADEIIEVELDASLDEQSDDETDDVETEIHDAAPEQEPVVENGFRKLSLGEPLIRSIERSGYTTPTPIQEQTIPLLLQGRDLLGQAQTGSGKTGAFALPLLQRIDISKQRPQVLVLVPTRELAIQVASAFEKYGEFMRDLRVTAIYGGAAYQPQFSQLKRGVHVVVGTPGRVMDHMNRGSLNLDSLSVLVLDEADEMLRMGFAESVEWVLTQMPEKRQIALFSATMPAPIRAIAQTHLRNPAEITIRQKTATADTIRQRFVVVGNHQKEAALARILEAEPIDGVIVFVKLRSTTEPLAEFLNQHGYKAAALNGDVAQAQRERIISQLKAGRIDVVVATDVAARGLDVQRISHVVNYDLPTDSEAYVHRIGRTGRAGRSGEAILFVHPRGQRMLKGLEYATRQKIESMDLPTNRMINKQRVARYHQQVRDAVSHPQFDAMNSIVEQFQRENPDVPLEQIAAALAVLSTGGKSLLMKDEFRQEAFAETRGRNDRRDSRDSREPRGRFDRGGRNDRGGRFEDRGPRERQRPEPASEGAPPFGESRRDRQERFTEGGQGQGEGQRRPPRARRDDSSMETFRIEVGHNHQVKPGNIVGAIANEAGIDSAQIGRIAIYEDFSTVDLPAGIPEGIFFALKKVWVSGRQLRISKSEGGEQQSPAPRRHAGPGRPAPQSHRPPQRERFGDRGQGGPRKPRRRHEGK